MHGAGWGVGKGAWAGIGKGVGKGNANQHTSMAGRGIEGNVGKEHNKIAKGCTGRQGERGMYGKGEGSVGSPGAG